MMEDQALFSKWVKGVYGFTLIGGIGIGMIVSYWIGASFALGMIIMLIGSFGTFFTTLLYFKYKIEAIEKTEELRGEAS